MATITSIKPRSNAYLIDNILLTFPLCRFDYIPCCFPKRTT